MDDEGPFGNIRDIPSLRELIGKRLVDITQNERGEPPTIYLMFDGGAVMEVPCDGDRHVAVETNDESDDVE